MPASSPYNVNIGYQGGAGAYGAVPGNIGLPSPSADLGAVYPNLSGSTAKTSSDILNELSGQLSPETLDAISNQAASFGVSSGMPLSGLSRNKQLESLGLTTEALQEQGIGDFLRGTQGVSATQTVPPALEAEIAGRNATMTAAPNPALSAGQQQANYQAQLNLARYGQNPNSLINRGIVSNLGGPASGPAPLPTTATVPMSTLPYASPITNAPISPALGPGGPLGIPGSTTIPTGNAYGDLGYGENPYGTEPGVYTSPASTTQPLDLYSNIYDVASSPYAPNTSGMFVPGGGGGTGGMGATGDWESDLNAVAPTPTTADNL